jgi:hypothetical protein
MKKINIVYFLTTFSLVLATSLSFFNVVFAQDSQINLISSTSNDVNNIDLFVSPDSGSFLGGSTFEIPFFINTKQQNVKNVELNISFDPTKLAIVKPSNGKSIIGVWNSAPSYDNNQGVASFSGTIPNGIISSSGLITSITFEAKSSGLAEVLVKNNSKVSLFDGTNVKLNTNRGLYTIFPKPAGAVDVFSDTHPLSDSWYNNTNVVLSWNKLPNIVGYSYVLDNKPNTLPENIVASQDTIKQYENLNDGLWYFHIKPLKSGGIWGTTTNRIIKIDTTPPNNFKPKFEYVTHDKSNFAVISFNTNDSLSGIDHYEIGITDTTKDLNNVSPVFNNSSSPYQLNLDGINSARVIVRAVDKAGNITDSAINIKKYNKLVQIFLNNKILVLVVVLALMILLYLVHYFKDHRIFKRFKMVSRLIEAEDKKLEITQNKEQIEEEKIIDKISNVEINDNYLGE